MKGSSAPSADLKVAPSHQCGKVAYSYLSPPPGPSQPQTFKVYEWQCLKKGGIWVYWVFAVLTAAVKLGRLPHLTTS